YTTRFRSGDQDQGIADGADQGDVDSQEPRPGRELHCRAAATAAARQRAGEAQFPEVEVERHHARDQGGDCDQVAWGEAGSLVGHQKMIAPPLADRDLPLPSPLSPLPPPFFPLSFALSSPPMSSSAAV